MKVQLEQEVDVNENVLYTKTHEWIRIEEDIGTVGITDYAQREMGDISYVEYLFEEGDEIGSGEAFSVLDAQKVSEECFLPLAGEVTQINENLEDEPELINSSPYGEGWLVKIRIQDDDLPGVLGSAD